MIWKLAAIFLTYLEKQKTKKNNNNTVVSKAENILMDN